jgi:hypothetical protein
MELAQHLFTLVLGTPVGKLYSSSTFKVLSLSAFEVGLDAPTGGRFNPTRMNLMI